MQLCTRPGKAEPKSILAKWQHAGSFESSLGPIFWQHKKPLNSLLFRAGGIPEKSKTTSSASSLAFHIFLFAMSWYPPQAAPGTKALSWAMLRLNIEHSKTRPVCHEVLMRNFPKSWVAEGAIAGPGLAQPRDCYVFHVIRFAVWWTSA